MGDATNCDNLLHFTSQQQSAIDLLLSGKNDRETAEAIGVHRTTVTRWRLYHPLFQAELNRRRKELYGAAADRLRSLLPAALDILTEELAGGDKKVQLALKLLQLSGIDKLPAPAGDPGPEPVIDKRVAAQRCEQLEAELDAVLAEVKGNAGDASAESVVKETPARSG